MQRISLLPRRKTKTEYKGGRKGQWGEKTKALHGEPTSFW